MPAGYSSGSYGNGSTARSERHVAGASAPFNRCSMKPVDIQLVPDLSRMRDSGPSMIPSAAATSQESA